MERLDFNTKFETKYCIPLWLRDEQIKQSTARIKGRIEPHYEQRIDPIALVGFGPSLNDTWEKLKDFKYIMTCSGSHKFLIEKGIIPTYHCEVDPRKHKVDLLGTPHPDVTYLIASSCNPKYFDWLEQHKANVKLWHVFDSYEEGLRILPHGEWALTGGSSVGLRMLPVARFLGFMDFHIFGMDGCRGESGSHTTYHPNSPKEEYCVDYEGKTYYTAPSLFFVAKEIFRELDILEDVTYTFYGEGLIQAIAKNHIRDTVKKHPAIGMSKPELISSEYRELNRKLHQDDLRYGVGGKEHVEVVLNLYKSVEAKSILDYGCGKGYLGKNIDFPIWEYDPCVSGKEESPRPADLVVCLNVLEHIEPYYLDCVLNDLARCTKKLGFFTIDTNAAQKELADGRNTHLIQQGKEWWREILSRHFRLAPNSIIEKEFRLFIIVTPFEKTTDDPFLRLPKKELAYPSYNTRQLWLSNVILNKGYTEGVEVGCAEGRTTEYLLKTCPNLKLHVVDLWDRVPEEVGGGKQYRDWDFQSIKMIFDSKIKSYNGRVVIHKGISWEMAKEVEDNSLDFVFVDADHEYESVKKDILAWTPKLKPEGLMCGHDIHWKDVMQALNELIPSWKEVGLDHCWEAKKEDVCLQ